MKTLIATALAQGSSYEAARTIVYDLHKQLQAAKVRLLFVFASTAQSLAEVTAALARAFPSARVLGASTAGEFTEQGDAKSSVSAFALAGDFVVHAGMGRGLKESPEVAAADATEELPRYVREYPYRTGFVLLDPLAGNAEEAALLVSSALGIDVPLAGGAAGDDLKMSSTRVALDGQAASDALVVATVHSRTRLGIGVAHGHRALSEPLKVTRAQGNVVYEVEGRPAWDVWLERTRERAIAAGFNRISREQEGAFLLAFEAGVATGADYKIRAPLSRSLDGSINFACAVEQGSVIRITESVPERQLESARIAARRARTALGTARPAGAVVFDCICRNLILGDRFGAAVKAISEELHGARIAGFETYGEIALDVGDLSGFHNTTSVVVAFPEA